MAIAQIVSASCLVVLGLIHSLLGESDILRPLFAADWEIPTPRWATVKILRFAWHLTSIAWFALAAVVFGANVVVSVALMALVSAGMIFVMLRGHLAWPLFLIAALAAFEYGGYLSPSVLTATTAATVTILLAAAVLHVYWAAGGRWLFDKAVPDTGNSRFKPGPIATLSVAGALIALAGLVLNAGILNWGPDLLRWALIAGITVLAARSIGETKYVGFTKTVRNSDFAEFDDRFFTPLIVFLALGSTGALLV